MLRSLIVTVETTDVNEVAERLDKFLGPIYGLVHVSTQATEIVPIVDVVKFIRETNGKFFSIKFKKRTTGELREMVARTGVEAYKVKEPTKPGLNFKSHDLIPVFDVQLNKYRSIPIERITEIKIDKNWKAVDHAGGQ